MHRKLGGRLLHEGRHPAGDVKLNEVGLLAGTQSGISFRAAVINVPPSSRWRLSPGRREASFRVGRTLLFLTALAAILSPVSFARADYLTKKEAAIYADQTLAQDFKIYYTEAYAIKLRCQTRLTDVKVRCRPAWVIGDLVFWGKLTIRVSGEFFYPRYRIVRFDEYCAAVEHGHDCKKIFRYP